jgi:DNA polymerase-3 subunit beta
MEFSCEKKALQESVSIVDKIITTRSTLPIIGNILFEAGKNGLKLSANNLALGIELEIRAKVSREGAALLPAKTLGALVSKLPETEISFRLTENGVVRISYDQSQFNLHSFPPDEFPSLSKVKEGKEFSINPATFTSMVKQTIFAVSTSEEKHILTGVLLEFGKSGLPADNTNLRMVATDGYRLAKRGEKVDIKTDNMVSVIVPARALLEIVKIMESKSSADLKITLSADQISFRCADVYLISRLIQGQFPDYKQVLPRRSTTRVLLNTKEFLRAAERAAVVASGSANITSFETKGEKVYLSAHTPDVGNVTEVLAAEIKGGEKIRASFNIRLITDVLNVIASEKTLVELGDGLNPGVIKPEGGGDYLYIIMPVRTQEVA